MGHVLRKGVNEPYRVALEFEVEGNRGSGRPRRWRECLKKDMEMRGLEEEDAEGKVAVDGTRAKERSQ